MPTCTVFLIYGDCIQKVGSMILLWSVQIVSYSQTVNRVLRRRWYLTAFLSVIASKAQSNPPFHFILLLFIWGMLSDLRHVITPKSSLLSVCGGSGQCHLIHLYPMSQVSFDWTSQKVIGWHSHCIVGWHHV